MNNLAEMIRSYKPDAFVSIDADVITLKVVFNLSLSEATILKTLLREYQAGQDDFHTKAIRQHIYILRRKLGLALKWRPYEGDLIVSMGQGFYAIPDEIKLIIKGRLEK